jgi:hypothetical protein
MSQYDNAVSQAVSCRLPTCGDPGLLADQVIWYFWRKFLGVKKPFVRIYQKLNGKRKYMQVNLYCSRKLLSIHFYQSCMNTYTHREKKFSGCIEGIPAPLFRPLRLFI